MKIINASNKNSFKLFGKIYYIQKENSQKNETMGKVIGLVPHWTAGDYQTFFDGYHVNFGFINNEVIVVKTLLFSQKGQHLWARNSGMIGLVLCAMKDWLLKPNKYQVDMMALFIAEYCCWYGLDPESEVTLPEKYRVNYNTLGNTGKMKKFPIIADHRTYAESDGYGEERQDILDSKVNPEVNYYEIVRDRAISYYKQLKANKRKFVFLSLLKGK